MKKSFSLIELVIIIVVVGILYSSIQFSLQNTSLNQAANQVISHINYTRHLAIRDNKIQYYPINNSSRENNRSKFWFKQWWHIKFTDANGDIIYYIFSDSPTDSNSTTFNSKINSKAEYTIELAKNPLDDTYLIGASKEETGNNYPSSNEITKQLNLTKNYNIQKIILQNAYSSSSMSNNRGDRIDILFDSYGTIYMDEGKIGGDAPDINAYDYNYREPLLNTAKIILCHDKNCEKNISICISSKIGNAYLCN